MKKVMITALIMVIGIGAMAQPEPPHERIKEARIEFMKKRLALTKEEEKNFLPLYSAMIDEMDSLRRAYHDYIRLDEIDLTFKKDKECEEIVDKVLEFRTAELEIIKRSTESFKKVLPIKKVAMIHKAEFEFKRELLKRLRKRGGRKR